MPILHEGLQLLSPRFWETCDQIQPEDAKMRNLGNDIPANFFSVKCVRFFIFTESKFLKIYQRLPKIAKDFRRLLKIAEDFRQLPKTDKDFVTMSEDNRRCRTIFKDFQMISKGFPTNLKHYLRVPKKFL